MKDLLNEYTELVEDDRIGKFFADRRKDYVLYPFAKTKKGYKVLLASSVRERQRNKVIIQSVHSVDFHDRGHSFYLPIKDENDEEVKWMIDNIKAHPKYKG